MHDMVKLLARVLVAMVLKNLCLCCGQGGEQWAGQKEGNWCCALQGGLEEDSPKQGRVVEVHMALLEDS